MKKVIIALALVVGFNSNAQDVVFTNGSFSIGDAIDAAAVYGTSYALNTYNNQRSFVIYSDGKINNCDLGNLENALKCLENIKKGISTEMYTVEPDYFGTKVVTFKGSDTKYYITPYLRKLATKAVKEFLNKP
jgi:hypothetical protein